METLTDIPFELDARPLMAEAHVDPDSRHGAELQALVDLAAEIARPKAAYMEAFIGDRGEDTVLIGDATFTSRALVRNLVSTERVFPHVATCGHELDEAAPENGEMLAEFWWDQIKGRLLNAADRYLREHLHRRYRLAKTALMRPGAAEVEVWPIQQQGPLFALLGDVKEEVGVTLTPSFLMIPNKSVSGVLFPTETDFRSCEVCRREVCPSRSAFFSEELWAELQHD